MSILSPTWLNLEANLGPTWAPRGVQNEQKRIQKTVSFQIPQIDPNMTPKWHQKWPQHDPKMIPKTFPKWRQKLLSELFLKRCFPFLRVPCNGSQRLRKRPKRAQRSGASPCLHSCFVLVFLIIVITIMMRMMMMIIHSYIIMLAFSRVFKIQRHSKISGNLLDRKF